MKNALLAAALLYVRRLGLLVLPLHYVRGGACSCGGRPGCKPGKHPRTLHGLKEATSDSDSVRAWWLTWPDANIGGGSGNIFTLDLDGVVGLEWLEEQERRYGPLPVTWRGITQSRGLHIHFLQPADGRRVLSRTRFAPGADIKSLPTGYVVLPPSRGLQGPYSWDCDFHPLEVPIGHAPEWLLALVTEKAGSRPATQPDDLVKLAATGVDEGGRNAALARLSGHLLRRFLDPYLVFELLRVWNRERCRPPLQENELLAVVSSIAKKEARRREACSG